MCGVRYYFAYRNDFSGSVKEWKQKKADLHKRPAIFIIQA